MNLPCCSHSYRFPFHLEQQPLSSLTHSQEVKPMMTTVSNKIIIPHICVHSLHLDYHLLASTALHLHGLVPLTNTILQAHISIYHHPFHSAFLRCAMDVRSPLHLSAGYSIPLLLLQSVVITTSCFLFRNFMGHWYDVFYLAVLA